jgi:uncharacterized membrane protein
VLRPFEKDLLDFAVGRVGDGRGFTMSGFKVYASKNRTKVQKWFRQWSKHVKEAGRREGFFEPYDAGAVLLNVGVGVVVVAAGIAVCAITSSPVGVPAIFGGAAQALLSLTFTRHTPEGRRHALAWRRFRAHLKSTSKAMGKVTLTSHEWSRYLAAAVVFGMHDKLLPALRLDDGHGRHGFPAWYVATMGDGGIGDLAGSFSSMISTMSSSTGAGGGASAGGGGGGGGGSAGAS